MSSIPQTRSIAPERVAGLMQQEQALYARSHARSGELFQSGQSHWLYGAPSHWMRRWIGGWPIYVANQARDYGVRFNDVDGNAYVDFCLGDTGGMCGHGHPAGDGLGGYIHHDRAPFGIQMGQFGHQSLQARRMSRRAAVSGA